MRETVQLGTVGCHAGPTRRGLQRHDGCPAMHAHGRVSGAESSDHPPDQPMHRSAHPPVPHPTPPIPRPIPPMQAEFISKIIPDPIEHGVVDALRKVVAPVTKAFGG